MLLISRVFLLLLLAIPANASTEPFKLGTFEYEGRELLGVVLRDQHVIDLVIANTSMERHKPLWVKLPMPIDMTELIGRYEIGLRDRIHAIVDTVVSTIDSSNK